MKPEVEIYALDEDAKTLRTKRAITIGKLIQSLEAINKSEHWNIIVAEILEPELHLLRKQLISEKDTTEVFRLQGKVSWAESKLDLDKLITRFKAELSGIRQQLHGKEEER